MNKILIKLLYIVAVPVFIIIASLLLPSNKSFKKSLMFAQLDKNKLLKETLSPRIIFIGGSNISFGLDSKKIKDSLKVNPINTGVSAGVGLKFMMANTGNYIKENDIIVMSPEYHQFYGDFADGDLDLLSVIADVSTESYKLLDFRQKFKLSKFFPEFASSKYAGFLKNDKTATNDTTIGIYDRLSFNSYGDVYIHWKLPAQKFSIYDFKGDFNEDIIQSLIKFQELVINKKAKLFITFPCYEDSSYEYSKTKIKEVEDQLIANGLTLISNPEEYKMPAKLMFNSAYHLNKVGVDYRTELLIKDLKIASK